MRYLLLASVLLAFLVMPSLAMANCTQYTVMQPGGKILLCQSCCVGGMCQVQCL